jgi:hypothetical protein
MAAGFTAALPVQPGLFMNAVAKRPKHYWTAPAMIS